MKLPTVNLPPLDPGLRRAEARLADRLRTEPPLIDSAERQRRRRSESGADTTSKGTSGVIDHGGLGGLADDDHTQYTKANGTRAFTGAQSMGGNKLTNVTDPTAAQDAATMNYVGIAETINFTDGAARNHEVMVENGLIKAWTIV